MEFKKLLYSLDEAREMLGNISTSTLYRLKNSGCIQIVKINGKSVISWESLDAYYKQITAPETEKWLIHANTKKRTAPLKQCGTSPIPLNLKGKQPENELIAKLNQMQKR